MNIFNTYLSYYLKLTTLCIISGRKQDRGQSHKKKQLQFTPILATTCDNDSHIICYQKSFKLIFVTNYKGGPILLAIVKKSP